MTRQAAASVRRPYEAPKVFRIRIAGDELAVAGCKTSTSSMGPTFGCTKGGPILRCKNAGS